MVTSYRSKLLADFSERGLIHEVSAGLDERMAKDPSISAYIGFDPSADSLHVGHLMGVLALRRLQLAGGRPIALVGGGTGMIGDPSGRSAERNLLDRGTLDANRAAIGAQLARLLDFSGASGALLLDNLEWLGDLGMMDFLRDTGKHLTVSYMLAKDSVKSRLEGGLSFTEFSYMLLQSYDFLMLRKLHGVELQMGGSDQWGNITAGTELIRKAARGEAHGLTFPLLTDAAGKKFGKTEAGAVWLDAARTSPYQFYQFWINTEDADVGRLLRTFTLLDRTTIEGIEAEHAAAPHLRGAQRRLAAEVTTLIHGAAATETAAQVSQTVFDKKADAHALSDAVFTMLAAEMPSVRLTPVDGAIDLVALLEQGFGVSKTAARKLIQQGAVAVNGAKVGAEAQTVAASEAVRGRWVLVRKGAREIAVAELVAG